MEMKMWGDFFLGGGGGNKKWNKVWKEEALQAVLINYQFS